MSHEPATARTGHQPTDVQLLAILADADGHAEVCGARGPYGRCTRVAGHTDGTWRPMLHVRADAGGREDWPVGWEPLERRAQRVIAPSFGRDVAGGDDYRAGFAAALELVREVLQPRLR